MLIQCVDSTCWFNDSISELRLNYVSVSISEPLQESISECGAEFCIGFCVGFNAERSGPLLDAIETSRSDLILGHRSGYPVGIC